MAALRAFIALELPCNVREGIFRLQRELVTSRADVKWVESQNAHMTLKFLGDLEEDSVNHVAGALTRCATHFAPMSIRLTALGVFPSRHRPRVLWVGAEDAAGSLPALARSIDQALAPLHIPEEKKPFHAHVTLGRVRTSRNVKALMEIVTRLGACDVGSFTAENLTLMKSVLTPRGPHYSPLHRAEFGVHPS